MNYIIEHLLSHGYEVGSVLADGKIHRFGPGRKSKWYICYENFLTGSSELFYVIVFGDWSTGETKNYCSRNLTGNDRKFANEAIEEAKRKNDEDRKASQELSRRAVNERWDSLCGHGRSAYLERKNISANGIRFEGADIYVPMRDAEGCLWSLQKIREDGSKYFHPGSKTKGTFFRIDGEGNDRVVYVAEGYATACSIHAGTGHSVFVAFNAGNLLEVAKIAREKNPSAKIIICGDDDAYKEKNIGREKAEEAAHCLGISAIFPRFETHEDEPTDFNDLHVREGIERVREQLAQVADSARESETAILLSGHGIKFPHADKKGKPKGTIENLNSLFRHLGITVRYNVISKQEDILIPGAENTIDNQANVCLARIVSWCQQLGIPTDGLSGFITALADSNLYNPVATWIESQKWDGQSRLQDFFDTISSPNSTLKEILMRKWLISAVAAIYEPGGVSAHGVLVLQGAQYIGKTKWFKSLAPSELGVLKDGVILRPDDKDSVFKVISKWIVELGELDATFNKSDIAQLKGFITSDQDIIRRPYAKKESSYARRTVFFASVNEENFLNDPTGNRRFWTINCESIDFDHCINMQQLWAEVRELYLAKESWYLSGEEMAILNAHNETFQHIEPLEERIRDYFAWDEANTLPVPMTSTAVCQVIGIINPTKSDSRAASRAIQKISGQKQDRKRKYLMPYHVTPNQTKKSYQSE